MSLNVYAQELKIDLSRLRDHDSFHVNTDLAAINIINKISKAEYTVVIDEPKVISSEAAPAPRAMAAPCSTAEFSAVENAMTEDDVAKNMDALEKLIKTDASCFQWQYDNAVSITTEKHSFPFSLDKDQQVFVTITREAKNGLTEKKWIVVLNTPRTVKYITHFGFTFVPNGIHNSDKCYSLETAPNAYTITRMNNNGKDFWQDLSLTANYIIPIFNITKNERVKFGWNAGFGVSTDAKFTVFTGPSVLFDDFASISFNGGLHNRYKLKGEYSVGQEINQNLSSDQLNESGLRPAFMISLGFRLSREQMSPPEKKGDVKK
jgi:hypothetical protein